MTPTQDEEEKSAGTFPGALLSRGWGALAGASAGTHPGAPPPGVRRRSARRVANDEGLTGGFMGPWRSADPWQDASMVAWRPLRCVIGDRNLPPDPEENT